MLVFCLLCRITQFSKAHRTESVSVMGHDLKPYLKQPRPQFPIQHNIETKNLKADALGTGRLSWPTHTVRVKDVRVSNDHRLDDEVGDLRPYVGDVVLGTTEVLGEVAERPLAAGHAIHVLPIVLAVLVDGVVGQVHVQMILHIIIGDNVLHR